MNIPPTERHVNITDKLFIETWEMFLPILRTGYGLSEKQLHYTRIACEVCFLAGIVKQLSKENESFSK